MLNKYLYKSNKEFYAYNIDIIIKKILKCIKYKKIMKIYIYIYNAKENR